MENDWNKLNRKRFYSKLEIKDYIKAHPNGSVESLSLLLNCSEDEIRQQQQILISEIRIKRIML